MIALAFPASPALAKRKQAPSTAQTAQPALEHSGYDLAEGGPELSPGVAPNLSAYARRHRSKVAGEHSVDPWAELPSPSMSYQAGKRGPVIELGAFSGDMKPLRSDNAAYDDGTIAHVTMAWRF